MTSAATTRRRPVSQVDRDAATRVADTVGRLLRMLRRSYVGSLGPASASALATLARGGPLRLGELAYVEGVTPAALSRVIASLERDGYVRRAADPADRRSAFVEATDNGRDMVWSLLEKRSAVLAERVSQLSVADRQTLLDGVAILEQLVTDPVAPPTSPR